MSVQSGARSHPERFSLIGRIAYFDARLAPHRVTCAAHLLLAHRHRFGRRVGRDVHALVEKGVEILVGERAHLLRVLEPEWRDQPEVFLVEDVEAAHLREARDEVLRDEALSEARRGADEVGVLGRDDAAARRARSGRVTFAGPCRHPS